MNAQEWFDALLKYAQMEEDSRALSSKDWDSKYKCEPSDFTHRMRANRRLALEKAREVQAAQKPRLTIGEIQESVAADPELCRLLDELIADMNREEVREGGE